MAGSSLERARKRDGPRNDERPWQVFNLNRNTMAHGSGHNISALDQGYYESFVLKQPKLIAKLIVTTDSIQNYSNKS